jgi:uncharacterized membrane protein YczE
MSAPSPRRSLVASRIDPRALARFVSGLAVASIGMTLMLRTELGAAPWEVFNSGLASSFGAPVALVRYGVVAAIVGLVLLLGARLGGALVATGFVGATWMAIFDLVVPHVGDGPVRAAVFAVGLVMMGVGVALYLDAGLGAGPHDALIHTVALRSRRSLLLARTGCELTALTVGALLGGAVGVGTVVFAVGLGPVIATATVPLGRRRAAPPSTTAVPLSPGR